VNSVSVHGVKDAPLSSNADCTTLRLSHCIRFQLAYLHITPGTTLQQDMTPSANGHVTSSQTNKRSIMYMNLQLQTLSKTKIQRGF